MDQSNSSLSSLMEMRLRIPACTLLLLLTTSGLTAQPAPEPPDRADARLRPHTIFEGQRALLQADIPRNLANAYPDAPITNDATVELLQTGTFRFGNQMRQAFYFEITPLQPGTFIIPSFPIPTTNSEPLQTQPQPLRVRPLSDLPDLNPENRPLFSVINIANTNPYVNQRQAMEIMIIARDDLTVTRVEFPDIEGDGWAMERFGETIEGTFIWQGRRYNTLSYQTYFSPLHPGNLTIGPAKVDCQVRVPEEGEGPFPFRTSSIHRLVARSTPMEINVQALPQGAPDGFEGAVGQFNLKVELESSPNLPSDPVTIVQTIDGYGDFTMVNAAKPINAKAWESIDLSAPEPHRTMQPQPGGSRFFRKLLRPVDTTNQIPAFRFVFFDPLSKEYKTLLTNPIEIPPTQPAPRQEPQTSPPQSPKAPVADDQIITTLPPTSPQWHTTPHTQKSHWQAHATATTAFALLLTAGLLKRYKSSPAGIRANTRSTFRKRLRLITRNIKSNPDHSLHNLMQWIEDWQHSSLARPLTNNESNIIANLRTIHHANRYAPNPRIIDTTTLNETNSLRSLLR